MTLALADRFSLSLKNNFTDEDGFPCCYFSNQEICQTLHCAHSKATRLLRELENARMLYRVRCGKGMADRLYVGEIPPEYLDLPPEYLEEYPETCVSAAFQRS